MALKSCFPGILNTCVAPRGKSDPVVFDPYSDEEQDNPYWERKTQLAADD